MDDRYYEAPKQHLWQGRQTKNKTEYWYQMVECHALSEGSQLEAAIAILGYACDEGVRRNQGRLGAAAGPDAIRSRLAKVAYHLKDKKVIDVGNILCPDQNLEHTQDFFAEQIAHLLRHNIFPIALGGGHDIAYAHFNGIWKAIKNEGNQKIGIINFDAHFDLRPVLENANSGTPFLQILQKYPSKANYLAIGIQEAANTPELFENANQHGVGFILSQDCHLLKLNLVQNHINTFIDQHDLIYLTVDLDGIASTYAPGVSAPSPLGMSPQFLWSALDPILQSGKLISCDIAEYNPTYDVDHTTATLAARLVEYLARTNTSLRQQVFKRL